MAKENLYVVSAEEASGLFSWMPPYAACLTHESCGPETRQELFTADPSTCCFCLWGSLVCMCGCKHTHANIKNLPLFYQLPSLLELFSPTAFNGNASVLIILWNSNKIPLILRSLWGSMYLFHCDATGFCIAGCSLHHFSITSCCWFICLILLYILHMEAFISLPGTFNTTTQAAKSLKCTVIIKNCLS